MLIIRQIHPLHFIHYSMAVIIADLDYARNELMRSYPFHTPQYVATRNYMHDATWLQIPQNEPDPPISALYDSQYRRLYLTTIVGVVNSADLIVSPIGDCVNSEELQFAQQHFSLSEPIRNPLPVFCDDFQTGIRKITTIHASLCDSSITNCVVPGDGNIHFTFPLFLRYQRGYGVCAYIFVFFCICSTNF